MHADAKEAVKYFDQMRIEHGFAELLSVEEFNDPGNGYLVNDCCVFGAEVFVIQPSTGSEETLTMVKDLDDSTYTWSIKDFSNLNEDDQYSDAFTVGGREWKLNLCLKGYKSGKDKYLSLFIWLQDCEKLVPKEKVYAKYKLRILDHSQVKTIEKTDSKWFDTKEGWGFHNLIPLKELSNGYLGKDTLTVEVEFDVISVIKVRT
ncbi:hypothetical protein Dsin_021103 [Dipteronia sinensis]|uniref:MATH domain-containing protein n=1 Tax=Dipteronia sinensis TaxID=43782 RepID=A0AAE0E465_9ROSI|nr:hypothetical protein Dsin_021103 [Dipteronia sinensis]